jgi:hypothetical protein
MQAQQSRTAARPGGLGHSGSLARPCSSRITNARSRTPLVPRAFNVGGAGGDGISSVSGIISSAVVAVAGFILLQRELQAQVRGRAGCWLAAPRCRPPRSPDHSHAALWPCLQSQPCSLKMCRS